MDFYGLNEDETNEAEYTTTPDKVDDISPNLGPNDKVKIVDKIDEDSLQENFEEQMADALSSKAEEILRAAEERGEDLDIDKVLDKVFKDSNMESY